MIRLEVPSGMSHAMDLCENKIFSMLYVFATARRSCFRFSHSTIGYVMMMIRFSHSTIGYVMMMIESSRGPVRHVPRYGPM